MTHSAENLVAAKQVGQYLIDAGVLTTAQLDEALDRQKRMSKAGFHVLLGTILEEMGAIDRQSLEAIILRQRLDEGSVNLGPEIDWNPLRPAAEAVEKGANGFVYPEPASPLTPEHAAEAMDAFFGAGDSSESADLTSAPGDGADPTATSASFVPLDPDFRFGPAFSPAAVPGSEPVGKAAYEPEDLPGFPLATSFDSPSWSQAGAIEPAERASTPASDEPVFQAVDGLPETSPAALSGDEPEFATDEMPVVEQPAADTDAESPAWSDASPAASEQQDGEAFETADTDSESPAWSDAAAVASEQRAEEGVEHTDSELPAWSDAAPAASEQQDGEAFEPADTDSESPAWSDTASVASEQRAEEGFEDTDSELPAWSETAPVDSERSTVVGFVPADPAATSTPVDISGFRFSRTTGGLAETQVSAVIGQLVRRTRALEEQVAEAKDNLSHLDSMRRYGEQSVKAADTIAQQIREEAEQQAAAIRDRAQQEARRIVGDARVQHDEIVHAAGEKAMEVAVEIKKSVDDHRAINETLINRAQELVDSDTTE